MPNNVITFLLFEAEEARASFTDWQENPTVEDEDDLERETNARYAEGLADGIVWALKKLGHLTDES